MCRIQCAVIKSIIELIGKLGSSSCPLPAEYSFVLLAVEQVQDVMGVFSLIMKQCDPVFPLGLEEDPLLVGPDFLGGRHNRLWIGSL